MNYCPNCGEKLSANFTFCPNCGATIPMHDTNVAQHVAEQDGNKEKRITLVGFITMLICFAFAAFCFFMAFSSWELRLFYIFGDVGHYINTVVFSMLGVFLFFFGIKEFFTKDKLLK